jgi:hypothetical protein
MKIQSLSVVVPAKKCINDCKFCVSKMHESSYEDMISGRNMYRDLYKKDFIKKKILLTAYSLLEIMVVTQ